MSNPAAFNVHNIFTRLKLLRMLQAAKVYIRHGWRLLPLEGKKPINGIGVKHATDDLKLIEQWLVRWPTMNIGGTPPTGVAVIDVDIYKHPAILKPFANELLQLGGPRQSTPNGGMHFLISEPVPSQGDLCHRFGIKDGIDVKRSGDGYVVLAPSAGAKPLTKYVWEGNSHGLH